MCSSQSSSLEEVVPDGNHKKKQKIQNKPPPNICRFMQQTVTFNNTQEVVSMNMSSTTSTLHTNSTPQPNDLPYSLPSTIIKPPVPSAIHQMSPPADLHISTMTTLWKYQPITSPILQLRFIH
ncbi:hypothetical protein O181_097257 [Austropuccinia psidii MF-1]|uniref:Uncharacterized protein n=1 Tax=Austropuccinia psidii MF-1 TaxID=1389203 RepID=A0A9Q3PEC0_9BASI|nr:hypothetical protein [Austropuccinia psidii MF-1]